MASLDRLSRTLADDLLDIGAVTLSPDDPFTWSSGLHAPVYCDNRQTLAHPEVRRRIADGFAEMLKQRSQPPTLIAGTATAGIPHATLLATRLALPLAYVRSNAKGHGKENRIEGADPDGKRVIVIEDLISTGQSALSAARALSEAGAEVMGVLAIFSYELQAAERAFDEAPWPLHVLTGFSTLLGAAEEKGRLTEAERQTLHRWHSDPEGWDVGQGKEERGKGGEEERGKGGKQGKEEALEAA